MRSLFVAATISFLALSGHAKAAPENPAGPRAAQDQSMAAKAVPAGKAPALHGDTWKQEFGAPPGALLATPTGVSALKQPAEMYGVAITQEEAEWLGRRGFLGTSERSRLSRMSEDELKARAKQRDQAALLYLAEKLIDGGRGNLTVPALMNLVDRTNSIPARYLLARYFSQGISTANVAIPHSSDPAVLQAWRRDEDRREAAASYLMQNYLLGDYRAGQMLYDLYPMDMIGVPPVVLTKAMGKLLSARAANPAFAATFDPRPMPKGTYGRGAVYPVN